MIYFFVPINFINYLNSLGNNKITSRGASILFQTLKECNSVVYKLRLQMNQIDDACINDLGEYVYNNQHLESIDLSWNGITDKGIQTLSEFLIGNTKILSLEFFETQGITDASYPYVVEIARKSSIKKINMLETSMTSDKQMEIDDLLTIPIEKRDIPINSTSKSAAKTS